MPKIIILSEEDCDAIVSYFTQHSLEVASDASRLESFRAYDPEGTEGAVHRLRKRVAKVKRFVELLEQAPIEHTIRVIVEGGCVRDVENLPMGFNYEVQDFDKCSECGLLDPECPWCCKVPF